MSGTTTKVRLVRCPKCRGILPELPNLQVYQCGGCGATLRAKIRKGVSGSSETPVANPAQQNRSGSTEVPVTNPASYRCESSETLHANPAQNNQSRSSEIPDTNPSQNNQSGHSETPDRNPSQNNQLEHASVAKQLSCSSQEVNKCRIETCEQVSSTDCDKEHSGSTQITNRSSFPGELNSDDKEELSESVGSCKADGNNGKAFNQAPRPDSQLVSGRSRSTYTAQRALDESIPSQTKNFSTEEQFEQSQKIVRHDSDHAMSRDAVETTEDNIIPEEEKVCCKLRDVSNESISLQTDNSSAEEQLEQFLKIVHLDSDHAKSTDEVETTTEYTTSEKNISNIRHRCLSSESSPSQTYNSSSEEQLEQFQKILNLDSDHVRSRDAGETTEATDNSLVSEEDIHSRRHRYVSKSPATRSSHAYDGSVSSYDGLDDQISDQTAQLFRSTSFESQSVSEFVGAKDRQTSEYFPVNNKMKTNTEVQKFSLSLTEKQGPVAMDKSTDWNQDILLDHTRNGIEEQGHFKVDNFQDFRPLRSRIGLDRDTGKRFYQRGSSASHVNCGSSDYKRKEFLHNSDFLSPHKVESVERNQVELLRKVDELRDQLNRSYATRENAKGSFPTIGTQQEHLLPMYYNNEQPEQEGPKFYDAKYSRHPYGAYNPSKSAPHLHGVPRIPFSGEATNCGHHIGYSCWHGYPEERLFSLQMPPHNIYHNRCLCGVHPVHMCYVPCISSLVYNTELLPHQDQGHMEHKVESLYHKERQNPKKQHYRPIAGGAPFVICYSCSELLHLPADFVLPSKRCHKLRCGSCSKVLLFSFNRRTIVPLVTDPSVPPPSEVESSNDVTTSKRLVSKSRPNKSSQGVYEVSNSEDYGLSILRDSCSTEEGDLTVLTLAASHQSHILQTDGVDEKHPSSNSSFDDQSMDDRKKKTILKRYGDEHNKNSVVAEMEKLSSGSKVVPLSNSPLHRLMGYSSPSEIIEGASAQKVRRSRS